MISKSIKIILLALFFNAPAWAKGLSCENIFSAPATVNQHIEILPEAQNSLPEEAYSRVLAHTHKLLAALEVPMNVPIKIVSNFRASQFDPIKMTITVGLWPQQIGAKSHVVNAYTLTHEYGHAIFEVNLIKKSSVYRRLKQTFIDSVANLERVEKELDQVRQNKALENKYLELQTFHKEQLRYWNAFSAMNEVFADVTTVVTFRDPKAFVKLMRDPRKSYVPLSPEELVLRDFTQGENPKARSVWEQTVIERSDPYYDMLPVRWEIWNLIKDKMQDPVYLESVLPRVFAAFENHLWQILTYQPADLSQYGAFGVKQRNQALIQELRSKLQ